MRNSYSVLINKLDEFIRKFYKNKILQGLYLFLFLFFALALVLILSENFFFFSREVRTVLFFSYVLLNIILFYFFIAIPGLSLLRMKRQLSYEEAAQIIGSHFLQVKDKLLNTLELQKISSSEEGNYSLALASIDQRITELQPLPFEEVISWEKARRYSIILVSCLLAGVILYVFFPAIINQSTSRLIHYNKAYAKPAPFSFVIRSKDLKAFQNESFPLKVAVEGKVVPSEMYLITPDGKFKLQKEAGIFTYDFVNLNAGFNFQLFADGYYSELYRLDVLKLPILLSFEARLHYPGYLHKKDETLANTSDLVIPAGTAIDWSFKTSNADKLVCNEASLSKQNDEFTFSKKYFENVNANVRSLNANGSGKDSLSLHIAVIPDLYPSIDVTETADSTSLAKIYSSLAKDDYGFSGLKVVYELVNGKERKIVKSENLPFSRNVTAIAFEYTIHPKDFSLEEDQSLEYYFQVTDNDEIAHGKSVKSEVFVFHRPSKEELFSEIGKQSQSLESSIKSAAKDLKDLQKEMKDFSKDIAEKKSLSWEDKRKGEEILNREKKVDQSIKEIQKENERRKALNEDVAKTEQEKAQMEELNKMLENLMTDEMKKMLADIEKLLQNSDKQKFQEKLDQMHLNAKNLEKELDRSLEFLKREALKNNLDKAAENLKSMQEKDNKLAEDLKKESKENKDAEAEKNEVRKDLEKFKDEFKKMEEQDKGLDTPVGLQKEEEQLKQMDQEQGKGEQEMNNGQKKPASKNFKQAAAEMQEMEEKFSQMKEKLSEGTEAEDMDGIRRLLKNLLTLSFDEEQLINKVKSADINSPSYLKIAQQQRKIKEGTKSVEDSLFALSKRVIQIKSAVNKEIANVNQSIEKSLNYLELRDVNQAANRQQFAMMSINNLALLLNESLQQMQQQMAAKKSSQSCSKPGSKKAGKKGMAQLRQKQQEMGEGMKPSDKGKEQQSGYSSEKLAKMAATQREIRNQLQKMMQEKGGNKGDLNDLLNEMEKQEKEIVNNRIGRETQQRQQQIMTRLLEAEKAERQQDEDNERESKALKNEQKRNPNDFAKYKEVKSGQTELIRTVSPQLKGFYKQKSQDYFQKLGMND